MNFNLIIMTVFYIVIIAFSLYFAITTFKSKNAFTFFTITKKIDNDKIKNLKEYNKSIAISFYFCAIDLLLSYLLIFVNVNASKFLLFFGPIVLIVANFLILIYSKNK